MKSLKIHLLFITLLAVSMPLNAQSLGKIKSRKIKEVEVVTVEKDKKGKEKIIRVRSKFDKKGNLLEEIVYRSDGTLKKRTEYEYNMYGDETARRRFNSKNELIHKKLTEYHPVFGKSSRMVYWEKGRTYKTRYFEYDHDGNRIREITRNGAGELVRERTYEHDARGMLTRKTETNRNGNTIKVDYQYEY